MGLIRAALFALLLLASAMLDPAGASATAAGLDCRPDRLWVIGPDLPPLAITVELADTPSSRARGLMHRTELAPGSGMLFVYEDPQPVAFWMRNTLIPLDMLFIDARGVIRHIHAGAIPHDETAIPGNRPGDPDPDRLLVLEIGGGEAATLGITAGMGVAHPALRGADVVHPCQ